ncbi:MAG: multidrug ABC transporter permease [Nitrospirae bacterium GWC2_57_13]|jgi:ABC-2 type transport system permease protein|nr:MAG: multidrug ABC transporter permease [Nitrospirae bacterium GWC1_57_7]OGW28434.1 MAG: multidrug ABC transporter permease [Nitrospirae bacterium GWC2_57_13]OGW43039.1 MAG: multidrug ABC transporter permease [Nitrospirae bacterium GWD2_57_8]HAS52792.1 multidrug ABC transporter permease [Nitrospiraceae bacterium]
MNFYPIFWKEMVLIRRKPWRFLASSMVMPLLYLVTFGWGLGRGIRLDGGTYLEFVLPGIIALSAMNNSFSPVSTSLNISKLYTKTIEEVLVSPVSPWEIAFGRALTGLVRGMFSAVGLLLVGLASGVHLQVSALFFAVIALTAFCFGSMGVAAAMVTRSHEDMANFNSFFMVPMSFLAGTFFAPDRMPEPFSSMIMVFPLTHASLSLRALAAGSAPDAISLLILSAYTVIFFILAGRLLRRLA